MHHYYNNFKYFIYKFTKKDYIEYISWLNHNKCSQSLCLKIVHWCNIILFHSFRGNLAYQANYCAGLRILNVEDIENARLEEVGYFDVAPSCNSPGFSGAWSNYPYFKSGTIIVSSIERGLFVLKYTGTE